MKILPILSIMLLLTTSSLFSMEQKGDSKQTERLEKLYNIRREEREKEFGILCQQFEVLRAQQICLAAHKRLGKKLYGDFCQKYTAFYFSMKNIIYPLQILNDNTDRSKKEEIILKAGTLLTKATQFYDILSKKFMQNKQSTQVTSKKRTHENDFRCEKKSKKQNNQNNKESL